MADLAVWQRTIVDERGNIIPGAEVEVRSYPGGSLITLYRGPDGAQIKGNPFRTGDDGFARFWAESQRAEIIAHGAGSTIRWIVDLLNADEVIGDAVTEATAAAADAVSEAKAEADRAEAARDAAQLNAGIYPSTSAGLAATTDGDYFSVPSSDDDEYLILYRNDSGSATEVSRTLSHGFEDNWLRIQPGIYFHDFKCEVEANSLYFLPLEHSSGNIVFFRGGYLSSASFSYAQLLADLANQESPPDADASRGVEVGVTSPSGWENCLRFYGGAGLWYNAIDGTFRAGNRDNRRRGDILLVHWNWYFPGWCLEEARIRDKLQVRDYPPGWAEIFTPHQDATPGRVFPNYSQSSKTLTLYADTILKFGTATYILPEDTAVEVTSGSTANSIYWVLSDDSIVVRRWSQSPPPDSVLIASLRDSPNAGTAVLSMPCPYTVDGDLFGLIKHAGDPEPNPVNASIRGIHHRGYSLVAPEDTLPAYIASAKARNYCVEGDIRWTSDGIPVLLHDATIDRTSDGTGNIAEMTLTEARAYDFGGWKGPEFTGTPIPTFEEALRLCKKLSLFAYWEIKAQIDADKAQEILRLIRLTGMSGHVELDSFRQSDLQLIVAEDPTQQVGRLGNMSSQLIAACVSLKTGENKVFAAVNHTTVTPELVEEARDSGIGVVVWTVNSPAAVMDMAALGVDGIMTDGLNIAEILRDSELS